MPERFSPREASAALGLSKKAVEQAIQRGSFPNATRDVNKKSGRVLRVWIPKTDLEEYARQRKLTLSGSAPTRAATSKRPASPPRKRAGGASAQAQQTIWQEMAEQQAQEILRLKVRIRELEGELAEGRSR
jgi:hypothetical protein